MGWSHVQTQKQSPVTATTSGATTALSESFSALPSIDNLVLVTVTQWSGGVGNKLTAIDDNQGPSVNNYNPNTVSQSNGTNITVSQTWVKVAASSGTFTVTAHFSQSVIATIAIEEWTDGTNSWAFDTSSVSTGNSNAPSSGSITPATADELFVSGIVQDTNNATYTVPAGFSIRSTQVDDSTFVPLQTASLVAVGSGAQNSTWASTGTAVWAGVMFAFKLGNAATLDQTAFRFGADDNNEASHSWAANENTNLTAAAGTKLVRLQVAATGDPLAIAYTLRAQKNGSGGYVVVPIGASTSPSLSWGAAGTIAYSASGGSSVAPTYPSGITANSCLVLVVGQKPSSANGGTVTTPTGWTIRASLTGANDGDTGGYGAAAPAADTGNCNIYVYTKDVVSGSESGTLSVTVGTNNVCWANIYRYQSSDTCTWSYDAGAGKDTSAGNVSIATGSMSVAAGDMLLGAMCIPTDVTTPAQFSAEAFSQSGTTFSGTTEIEEPDSATGNDIGGFVCYSSASAGSGSGAVTMTATAGGTTTNVRGPGIVLRIRAVSVNNEVYVTSSGNIAAGGEATTARLSVPGGKSFTTGRRWDDENGTDTIDVANNAYTEVEWCVALAGSLNNGDYFDFRAYAGAAALGTYTNTARWTIGGSGAVYTQNVSGVLSFVGTLPRAAGKQLSGAASFSGALPRRTAKAPAGSLSFVGTPSRQTGKQLSGAASFSGALARVTGKALSGAASFAGGLTRASTKALGGAVSFAGTLPRQVLKGLAGVLSFVGTLLTVRVVLLAVGGTLTFAGNLSRQTTKALAGALSPAGTTIRSVGKPLAGAVGFVGTLPRSVGKPLAGAVGFAGVLSRSTAKGLAGVLSFAGTLPKTVAKSVSGAVSFSGGLTRGAGKALSGAVGFAGGLVRQTGKVLSGAVTTAGALARSTAKGLAGVLSFVGATTTLKVFLRAVGGTLSFSGGLGRTVSLGLGGSVSFLGTLPRSTARTLAGALSLAGGLARGTSKGLVGVLSFVGALQTTKVFLKAVGGALSFAGGLTRQTGKALSGVVAPAGALTRSTAKAVGGVLSFTGTLLRLTTRGLSGAVSFSGRAFKQTRVSVGGVLSFFGGVLGQILGGFFSLRGAISVQVRPAATTAVKVTHKSSVAVQGAAKSSITVNVE